MQNLAIRRGTLNRWMLQKKVPANYRSDLEFLLTGKYPQIEGYKEKDQFYTTKQTATYCYKLL